MELELEEKNNRCNEDENVAMEYDCDGVLAGPTGLCGRNRLYLVALHQRRGTRVSHACFLGEFPLVGLQQFQKSDSDCVDQSTCTVKRRAC